MKLSNIILFGVVAGLSLSNYLSLRTIDSLSSETRGTKVLSTTTLASKSNRQSSDSVAVPGEIGSGRQREMTLLREEFASEFASLRAEVSALQRQLHIGALSEVEDPDSDAYEDPVSRAEARAEAEEEYREIMAVVETEFSQERSDQDWSFETQTIVQQALDSDETLSSALMGFECRSQTCRVELADDGTGNLNSLIPTLMHKLGETLPNVRANHIDDDDGGQTTVLYMSRDLG